MDSLVNRYRNLTVLVLVIFIQLMLVAYQVKTQQDIRLLRVWAVTAVTPFARVLESVRSRTMGAVNDYLALVNVRAENKRLQEEIGKLKLDNRFLRNELATADRVKALTAFQSRTPSRTIPAKIIASSPGANSRGFYVNAGSGAGVMRGMAVITPDGIVGKVTAAYPTASQVMLLTDPEFAAGVVSQRTGIRGTYKGQGHGTGLIDYIPNEQKIEVGDVFYTSGEDWIFPKGLPAGRVTGVSRGRTFQNIQVAPLGLEGGLEEVLIVLEGVHQEVPPPGEQPAAGMHLTRPPQENTGESLTGENEAAARTDADRLRLRYKRLGEAQGHRFGEGGPGTKPPDFNLNPAPAPSKQRTPAATSPASERTPEAR